MLYLYLYEKEYNMKKLSQFLNLNEIKKLIKEEININELKRPIYKPVWDKGDHILAWFNSKYGVEQLGYSEQYIANSIIGTSLSSFKSSTSNFNVLDGRPGLDNYINVKKNRDNDAQIEVYREYKDTPVEKLKRICLNYIEEVKNDENRLNKFMIGKEIGDKREKDKKERENAIRNAGMDPNKLTFIGRRPTYEPNIEPDDIDSDTNIEEPTIKQKTTPKDEIKDYIQKLYQKFVDSNPSLADDLSFLSDYIDQELVDKNTLNEIKSLFILDKKRNKVIIKESDIKNIVKKLI